jgi:hypothetical protein
MSMVSKNRGLFELNIVLVHLSKRNVDDDDVDVDEDDELLFGKIKT